VQEECPLNFRNNGICLINSVANPLRSEDATVWSDIKNRTFLGPLGVTTTTSMASTLSASVSESTGSVHTTQLAPSSSLGIHSTPAPISSGTGSGKVSAGAIAGAAIGALMGVGLAVVGVIFLTRRYTKKVVAAELEKLHNDGKQKPEVEEQQVGWRDNIWRAELEAKGGGMRQSERDDEAADLQQSEHEGKVEELRWVGGELDEEHAKVKRG
jgi:hypothetical protein